MSSWGYTSDAPNNFRTPLGESLFNAKYALYPGETWLQRCAAVVDAVCGTQGGKKKPLLSPSDLSDLTHMMHMWMFIPGGRYLYYAGRGVCFFNNCFIFLGEEDTREEWGRILRSASDALMSGGGIGVDYSVFREHGRPLVRTGGVASGPIPLAISVNNHGRNVMQGGSRRSAIYASLGWQHRDAERWLNIKDWANQLIPGTNVSYADAKQRDFDAEAPLDFTNISLNYDDHLLDHIAQRDVSPEYAAERWEGMLKVNGHLPETFLKNTEMAMRNGEPGFSFNFFAKENETGRNACVTGDTPVLTQYGHQEIAELVDQPVAVFNGAGWSTVTPFFTGEHPLWVVTLSDGRTLTCSENHEFVLAGGAARIQACELEGGEELVRWSAPTIEIPVEDPSIDAYSQGFYAAEGNYGRRYSWIYESKLRCAHRLVGSLRTIYRGRAQWLHGEMAPKDFVPLETTLKYRVNWLAGLLDGDGTVVRSTNSISVQLGSVNRDFLSRVQLMLQTMGCNASVTLMREARIAELPGSTYPQQAMYRLHLDAHDLLQLAELGLVTERLDLSGNNPQRDASRKLRVVSAEPTGTVEPTYCFTEHERHMGVFNGVLTGQCTEVCSADDSDMCNLGSLNLAAIPDLSTMRRVTELGAKFLICGTIRAALPDEKTKRVREKNRRIGLGLMGVHEWMLQHGARYEVSPELHEWLEVYRDESEEAADDLCDRHSLSRPAGYRAVAPTGTIGTMAGTTTGMEPIFAAAYKRRYLEKVNDGRSEVRHFQYVIDSSAQDLSDRLGVNPDTIETSLDLAHEPERRLAVQADIQDYVDMGISSTINLPAWGDPDNNPDRVEDTARSIARYAPRLRGLTFYPDGSRGGQPLVRVPYAEAHGKAGQVFEENGDRSCKSGVCGI